MPEAGVERRLQRRIEKPTCDFSQTELATENVSKQSGWPSGASTTAPIMHNPHSRDISPRILPCQACGCWIASILQPQTSDEVDLRWKRLKRRERP